MNTAVVINWRLALIVFISGIFFSATQVAWAADAPRIEHIEFLGEELSLDKHNPTILPYVNNVIITGNGPCASQKIDFWLYLEGYWTRGGIVAEFDKNCKFVTNLSCPIVPYDGFPAIIEYNRTLAVKYTYQEYTFYNEMEHVKIISESPTYYIIFLPEPDDWNNRLAEDNHEALTGIYVHHFPDVNETNWANSYIQELVEKNVLSGYVDGTFRPEKYVTRSEFAKMMTMALKIPLNTNAQQSFTDISKNDWEFFYVETAKKYMTGYQQGGNYYFRGDEPAAREDVAVALVKALGYEKQQVDVNDLRGLFTDYNTISTNKQKNVLIAAKNSFVLGYPDGTFGAQKPITRAETAALLSKVMKSTAMQKITFNTDY